MEVKDTLTRLKKLKTDIAVVRTVNDRLVETLPKTERQCCENVQYSQRDTLETVGIPISVGNSVLEETCVVSSKTLSLKLTKMFKPLIA